MHFNTIVVTTMAAFLGTGVALPMSGVHSTTITKSPFRDGSANAKGGSNVDANANANEHIKQAANEHNHATSTTNGHAATSSNAHDTAAESNINNRKASGPARFNTHAQLNNTDTEDRTAIPSGSLVLSADDRKLICRAMCAMDGELCIMATLQDGGVCASVYEQCAARCDTNFFIH